MFGKAKSSSHEKDEHLPSAPQLQDLTPASWNTASYCSRLRLRSHPPISMDRVPEMGE